MSNVFEIFGLPPEFDLDAQQLERRFIELSSATHPDRFTDPLDQADAAERAAVINHAYAVLKDPEKRAGELLTILGGPGKSDDKSLPPELLTDMLEVREKMEEAIAADDKEKLSELAQWARDQRQAHLQRVAALFAKVEAEPVDKDATLKAIRLELNALRYFERMIEQSPGA